MKKSQHASAKSVTKPKEVIIKAGRAGGWASPEEFQREALAAAGQTSDAVVDVQDVDYLDASALQILLSLAAAQQQRGHSLRMIHVSEQMKQWLEYSGASEKLSVELASR